jgi:hypothetical protein
MLWAVGFGLRLKPKEETLYLDTTKPEELAENADPERATKSSTSPSGRLDETESRSAVNLKETAAHSVEEAPGVLYPSEDASEYVSSSVDDMESLNDSPTPSSGPSTSDAEDW